MPELTPSSTASLHQAPLHMVQLHMSSRRLARSAQKQNIPRRSGDMGYVLHGQLAALFGDLAPKPFHAVERRGSVTVLGYTDADAETLRARVEDFAEPFHADALQDLATKTMPSSWVAGRRLGFELRVCPTIRHHKKERDAYRAEVEKIADGEDVPSRESVYRQWLARRLEGAAELCSCRMTRFQRVRLFRRHQGDGRRKQSTPEFPEAVFQGELEIVDGSAFAQLLARGVGRHRAFGFGMLLLRPPSRS